MGSNGDRHGQRQGNNGDGQSGDEIGPEERSRVSFAPGGHQLWRKQFGDRWLLALWLQGETQFAENLKSAACPGAISGLSQLGTLASQVPNATFIPVTASMSGPALVSYVELLDRTAAGDRQAFKSLYLAAGPRLFAIAIRMMRSRDLAEDVLQEAFVKIWERSWQFDPAKGEALAWLATVTRHTALDRLRKQPRSVVAFDETVVEEIDAQLGALTSSLGEASDLRRCLSNLREDYRKAVILAYINGLTHEELAQQLGKPVGTVKSWMRRGLEQLKGCMDA